MTHTFPADFRRVVIRQGDVIDTHTPDFIVLFPTTSTTELWATPTKIDPNDASDYTPDKVLFPQTGEMKFRVLEFNPAPEGVVSNEAVDDMLSSGGGSATRGDLHRTMSTDYFVVLSGRITLMAEEGEVELGPGDTAICLGAMHGWVCRTDESARIFSVLIGASRFGDEGSGQFRAALAPAPDAHGSVRRVVLGHRPDGRAAILADAWVSAPAVLWSSDSPPDNTVVIDRGSAGLGEGHDQGTRFLVDHLAAAESRRLPDPQGQLIGVVIEGSIRLQTEDGGEPLTLSADDTFVIVGTEASVTAHDGPARLGLVALRGLSDGQR